MACAWAISKDCHVPKKNFLVCTACWKEADENKQETYKDLEGGWCTVFGCWNPEVKDTGLCTTHNRSRSRSRSARLPTTPRPSGSSQKPLLTAQSKAPPPSRLLEPMLKLRSEEITEMVREGVLEIYRRTVERKAMLPEDSLRLQS